jgi:hypothetical protein
MNNLPAIDAQTFFKDSPTILDISTCAPHSQLNDTANEFNNELFFMKQHSHIRKLNLSTKVESSTNIPLSDHQAHYSAFGYCALCNAAGYLEIRQYQQPEYCEHINVNTMPGRKHQMCNQIIITKTPWKSFGLYLARNDNTIEIFTLSGDNVTSYQMITSGMYCVNHISLNSDATLLAGANSDGDTH